MDKSTKNLEILFTAFAFFLQSALIIHFAIRKPLFESYTMKYGWWIYALCLPALAVSIIILIQGGVWYFWLGGFLFTLFAIFGYTIEYVKGIPWRSPILPRILAPYVTLYLASIMFYWWPLARIDRKLWLIYAALFVISTVLNIISH